MLLADDHRVLREGLKALLEAAGGIEVVGEADDGWQAVQRALELRPDVVVMDVGMPKLNGFEAARELRAQWPQSRVVMLSMHSTLEHVYQAFAAGAIGYLLKESAGVEVVAAVRSACAGRRYLALSLREAERAMAGRGGASPLERLSARERQVLQLVAEGQTSAGIAEAMKLSPKTVETYRSRLMAKLGVRDLAGLIKLAIQHGITPLH